MRLLNSTDNGLTVLHKFCALANCADGERPQAGVILNKTGEVLGMTEYGGEFGVFDRGGTIFRLKPPL